MALSPFSPGEVCLDEDFDAASALLDKWLAEVTPLYLQSTEYRSLSRVNRRARGDWFGIFMGMYLGYIGTHLADLDEAGAREILTDLFPDKVICPDRHAKTIVPELVAFWKFLRRECGDRKLKHAAAVIDYLKSIQKHYLKIYNRESGPDRESELESLFGGTSGWRPDDVLSTLSSRAGLRAPIVVHEGATSNFFAWVQSMLEDVLGNIYSTGNLKISDNWEERLQDPVSVIQVVCHFCLNTFELDDYDESDEVALVEAIEEVLVVAFQNLVLAVESRDEDAIKVLKKVEHNMMQADRCDLLDCYGARPVFWALRAHHRFLSPQFLAFAKQWNLDHKPLQAVVSSLEAGDCAAEQKMVEEFDQIARQVDDEFALVSGVQNLVSMVPHDAMPLLFDRLVRTGDTRMADAIVLYLSADKHDVAEHAVVALQRHRDCVSGLSLRRLICTRNWLYEPAQTAVDTLIRSLRKEGVEPSMPAPAGDILEAWMPALDGVGSQGFMLMFRRGSDCQLISAVFQKGVGIVDVVFSAPGRKKICQDIVKETKSRIPSVVRIEPDLVRALIPVFLAEHRQSQVPVDYDLVRVLEVLGMKDWNPQPLQLQSLLPEELFVPADEAELARVQKASKKWSAKFGMPWFEKGDEFADVLNQSASQKERVNSICNALETRRSVWRARMLRMALWAHYSRSIRLNSMARDFVIVSQLLASDLPAREIGLIRSTAADTIASMRFDEAF